MSMGGGAEDIGVRLSLSGQSQFNQGMDQATDKVDKLGKKSDETGRKGKAAGIGIGQAFSPLGRVFSNTLLSTTPLGTAMQGLLQSTSGVTDQLSQIEKGHAGSTLQKLGTFGAVGGAGIVAAGTALDELGSPLEAARHQLETAVTDTGANFDDLSGQMDSSAKHMQNFGFREQQTYQALATLTSGLKDPQLAIKYMGETADIAASKHISLADAAQLVVQIHAGGTRAMRQFGITAVSSTKSVKDLASAHTAVTTTATKLSDAQRRLSDLQTVDSHKTKITVSDQIALRNARDNVTKATQAHEDALQKVTAAQAEADSGSGTFASNMDLIGQRTKGQASAAVDSFGGKLDVLKTKILDAAGQFGQKYGPAIMGTGAALTAVGSITTAVGSIMGHFSKATKEVEEAQKAAKVATETTTTATEVQQTLFDADTLSTTALSGALDASAVSEGAAAGGFDLMSIAAAAFDAIPIVALVVGIAIAIAALVFGIYELATHWSQVWSGIKSVTKVVWDWIKENWPYLVGILAGPIGIAAAIIFKHWSDIKGAAADAWQFIQNGWNTFVSFFESIPARIGNLAGTMWNGISDAFRSMLDILIGAWDWIADRTQFTVPGLSLPVVGQVYPSFTIGPILPDIPKLHAGGTVVTGGNAVVQPGEEMIRLPSGAQVVPLSGGAGMDPSAYGKVGPVTLQVVLDRRVVAKAVYDDLRDQAARR